MRISRRRSSVISSRSHQAFLPVRIIQTVVGYHSPSRGRVYETGIARIDAHMGNRTVGAPEEHQIARLQILQRDRPRMAILGRCRARYPYARLVVGVIHQSAAIETPRCRSAIAIGRAEFRYGDIQNRLMNHGWFGVFRNGWFGGFRGVEAQPARPARNSRKTSVSELNLERSGVFCIDYELRIARSR